MWYDGIDDCETVSNNHWEVRIERMSEDGEMWNRMGVWMVGGGRIWIWMI